MEEPKGVFISFEGGDGAGKSTQIRLLAERLRNAGREVVLTREPGGSPGGEVIRRLLVEGDKDRWSAMTDALLVYAARRDHLEKTILPALAHGAIVLTDRFSDSTTAYQGVAGNLGTEVSGVLERLVVGDDMPDLTIILDVPVTEGLERAGRRDGKEDRYESKGSAFQKKVRQAFLQIAKDNPERCIVIDATNDLEVTADAIWQSVIGRFPAFSGRRGA